MAQTSTYKGNLTKIDKMKELSASGRERDADPMKKLIALQKMTNQLLIELLDEKRGSGTTETIEDYKSEVQEALVPNKVLADRMLSLISTNTMVMIELLESMKRLESSITGIPPLSETNTFDREPINSMNGTEE